MSKLAVVFKNTAAVKIALVLLFSKLNPIKASKKYKEILKSAGFITLISAIFIMSRRAMQ